MIQRVVVHTLEVFWLSMAISMSIATGSGQSQKATDMMTIPNIVFILADDLGYSDVNCFNGLDSADYYEYHYLASQRQSWEENLCFGIFQDIYNHAKTEAGGPHR